MIAVIDPGYAAPGNAVAIFGDSLLHVCCMSRDQFLPPPWAVSRVVVERPEFQGAKSMAARVQDLVNLAWSGAMLAGHISGQFNAPIHELPPSKWKGSVPKPVTHMKAWLALTFSEAAVIARVYPGAGDRISAAVERGAKRRWPSGFDAYSGWKGHNILDAVTMGMVYLGRIPSFGR